MASVFEAQTLTKQATSDREALRIAKNVLKLLSSEVDAKSEHSEFCRDLMVKAVTMGRVGSVQSEPR